jgi:hypothetical protein
MAHVFDCLLRCAFFAWCTGRMTALLTTHSSCVQKFEIKIDELNQVDMPACSSVCTCARSCAHACLCVTATGIIDAHQRCTKRAPVNGPHVSTEHINAHDQFMHARNFPLELCQRLRSYYMLKFPTKMIFDEESILLSLEDSLRKVRRVNSLVLALSLWKASGVCMPQHCVCLCLQLCEPPFLGSQ